MAGALTHEVFRGFLEGKVSAAQMTKAIELFEGGGNDQLRFAISNALMWAADKDKLDEVLEIIQKHFNEHLTYQHPDIRGQISKLGVNPTDVLFRHIYEDVLGLTPIK